MIQLSPAACDLLGPKPVAPFSDKLLKVVEECMRMVDSPIYYDPEDWGYDLEVGGRE